ncbi:MAG TPA: prolyl oligopeptidase family serine peptidase [Candidatus Krumholzibacteriaceae bacterium]|nr:prolyl oligopeptidase family serine peptidase [Candidatus Krumholzibacteriaceae bacterium]
MLKKPSTAKNAPWKKRYLIPRIRVEVARTCPNRALVVSNKSGLYELYAFDLISKSMRQVTNRPSGTVFGTISPDGKHIYYLDDKKGNETGHFVRVPFEQEKQTPQDLTPSLPPYSTLSCFIDDTSSHFGITVPTKEGFDSYVIRLSGDSISEPRRISRNNKVTDGPIFSHDGKVSVLYSAERYGGLDFTLNSFNTENGQKINEIYDESSRIEPSTFLPHSGDQRILATSNKTGAQRPLVWDAITGTRVDLKVNSLEGDIVPLEWTSDAKRILLCQISRAYQQLWLYELTTAALTKLNHPSGTIDSTCFQSNDTLLIRWQDSTTPPKLIALHISNDSTRTETLLKPGPIPPSRPWRSVSFPSSDGQEIQGWLATPKGTGPFPTILETHGGPTAAQFNAFYPQSQAWLDHGFAYLTINYRGSTTFGKEFEKKINGDLGHWEVEDMVAAHNWLVKNKIAHPDQILLTGWSYGGYLTLQAMGVHPELWAGGMGGVVVADWITQYEDESESLRGYDVALFGGTPSEKRDIYERASPITYVSQLAAPVLIIQGKNDTRDPPRQVELYEAKAHAHGKDVKVQWFETGHAATNTLLSIAHQQLMLKWAYNVLKAHTKKNHRITY